MWTDDFWFKTLYENFDYRMRLVFWRHRLLHFWPHFCSIFCRLQYASKFCGNLAFFSRPQFYRYSVLRRLFERQWQIARSNFVQQLKQCCVFDWKSWYLTEVLITRIPFFLCFGPFSWYSAPWVGKTWLPCHDHTKASMNHHDHTM